jgi:predicted enzyme related to lactoylglutathione lyase
MADLLHGRFVWSELTTTDPKAAEGFYKSVVGWTSEPFPGAGMPYTIWKVGDKGIGGMMAITPEMKAAGVPPNWVFYVGVHDADAAAARAKSLGGRIEVPPSDIPDVGRFAILSDPQGAHFAILQPQGPSPSGPDAAPTVGEISWRELATTDLQAAMSFYSALFGWEMLKPNDMGPLGIYQEFGRFGRSQGGIYRKPAEMPFPPHWLLYASVRDLNAAVATVKSHGGTVLNGPMEVPGGDLIAQIMDPQGAAFALHQAKS